MAKPKRFLTHDQVQALAAACAPYDTLIRVLAYAGLRWAELVARTACRIDLARRRIEVVEAITEVYGRLVVGTTKTQRCSVPIPASWPMSWRTTWPERPRRSSVYRSRGRGAPQYELPAAVFRSGCGEGRTAWTDPHELRHTAASLAIAAGANVKAVQLMLGHASAAMTLDIYAGLFADDLDAVADRLYRGVREIECGQMRTKRRTSRSDQTELPFDNPLEQGTG